MNKKIKLLLVVSLLLNMVLIGFIGGKISHHKIGSDKSMPLISFLENASISDDKRTEFITELNQSFKTYKVKSQNRRLWEDKAQEILTADSFDADAYRTQLMERAYRNKSHKDTIIDTMVDIASILDLEDRVKMAEVLERQSKRSSKRHHAR